MADARCRAAARKTLTGVFGERCGKPATVLDWLGRPVCPECQQWIEAARVDAASVASVLREIYHRRTGSKS